MSSGMQTGGHVLELQSSCSVEDTVCWVNSCELRVEDVAWGFAHEKASEIEEFWQRAVSQNPKFFNGTIYMMRSGRVSGDKLEASVIAVEFKTFLYWRDVVRVDKSAWDCFGSAILVSQDNKIMLARQRAGNINSGLTYLPGGFIDPRDVQDGFIDISSSVARELEEETGLTLGNVTQDKRFLVTVAGQQVSIGVVYRAPVPGHELTHTIHDHLANEDDPELDAVVFVGKRDDLARHEVPRYAKIAVSHLFG